MNLSVGLHPPTPASAVPKASYALFCIKQLHVISILPRGLTYSSYFIFSQTSVVSARPVLASLFHAPSARPLVASRPTLTCTAAAAEEPVTSAPTEQPTLTLDSRPDAVTPAWQEAIDLLQSGEIFVTTIESINKSGAIVKVGKLNGFVPYKLMNRALLSSIDRTMWTQKLIGRPLTVKVTQVVIPERRLICSEKAAMLDKASKELVPGAIVSGTVTSLHNFGAFVEVDQPLELAGTDVILPLREISWDWISTVNSRLQKGQQVAAIVTYVNPPPNAKVVVSTKRLEEDPLKETLDKVLPLDSGAGFAAMGAVSASIPTGVEDVLEELTKEAGVKEVNLGRRVEEQRTVSQDLELWISKDAVADGFSLVARAGRVAQEINVVTDMSAGEMRAAVQRVLKRVN